MRLPFRSPVSAAEIRDVMTAAARGRKDEPEHQTDTQSLHDLLAARPAPLSLFNENVLLTVK
jgi:hypothetical protein